MQTGLAILRCLVDFGLRSSEVVSLRLDDIDWQAGTIRIAKPKSHRVDVLPAWNRTEFVGAPSASNRNGPPASIWNAWPASSESAQGASQIRSVSDLPSSQATVTSRLTLGYS
jgi:integrase